MLFACCVRFVTSLSLSSLLFIYLFLQISSTLFQIFFIIFLFIFFFFLSSSSISFFQLPFQNINIIQLFFLNINIIQISLWCDINNCLLSLHNHLDLKPFFNHLKRTIQSCGYDLNNHLHSQHDRLAWSTRSFRFEVIFPLLKKNYTSVWIWFKRSFTIVNTIILRGQTIV